ncbi:unnamed protein product [Rotaria socialis]|uniref:Uncharacterized protein n=1 Tax=Rotaria socialis TaxID=392032 RepID=A0A821P3U0_9BILA|nr:unnamed protein product [Rotaria socialis]
MQQWYRLKHNVDSPPSSICGDFIINCTGRNTSSLKCPLVPCRSANDDRKYVEILGKKWPQDYILLGDAMCVFNPQCGQGMAHGLVKNVGLFQRQMIGKHRH